MAIAVSRVSAPQLDVADRAGIGPAAGRLQLVDDLHGAHLGGAAHGAGREAGAERGEGVDAGAQPSRGLH